MHSLAVWLVSCSVYANRTRLRCAIGAAALRTASSWRCAAAFIGLSACLVSCRCRACVTAPVMVASWIRGALNRWLAAWCAWLCDGKPSCCCRVSAGDQPTSLSLPAWRGHVLKCSQSSEVVWSHEQRMCFSGIWICLQASQRATLVRSDSCSLRSWMRRFCRWAGTHPRRSAES